MNINLNFDLSQIPVWFGMLVERLQHLTVGDFFMMILAIAVPPLAALIKVGFTTHFWVNLLLTVLGYLPGQIHALWLVLFN